MCNKIIKIFKIKFKSIDLIARCVALERVEWTDCQSNLCPVCNVRHVIQYLRYGTLKGKEKKTKTLKNNSVATIACRCTIQLIFGKSPKFVFLCGMNVWCNELWCVVLWCGKEMNSPLFHMDFTSKLFYFHIYFHTNCYT